jgi:hypothetical protein
MDIHKPKPWHGVREFLKEYAIIVIGVLTALGAEQAVEGLHVRREVSEAREALHDEIAANSTIALFSIEEDRCLAKGLDGYARWAQGGPHAQPFRTRFPDLRSSAWEEVRSGPVTHMPLQERLQLAAYYDGVRSQLSMIALERNAFVALIPLDQKPQLSPADAQRLLEAVAQARLFGAVRSGYGRGLLAAAKAMKVEPHPIGEGSQRVLAWECSEPGSHPPSDEWVSPGS